MIKSFKASSKVALLASLALSTLAPANAQAAGSVNVCSKWNNIVTLNWIEEPQQVRVAAQHLLNARSHGLAPKDYDALALVNEAHALTSVDLAPGGKRIAAFNRNMTRSVACYLQNVKGGRLNPHAIYKQIWLPRQKLNVSADLRAAFDAGTLDELLENAAPQGAEYSRLRRALSRLRAQSLLEADPGLPKRLSKSLKLGHFNAIVPALRDRLAFLGDLVEKNQPGFEGMQTDLDPQQYDFALLAAVSNFQKRHGMKVDGAVGSKTLRALGTAMPVRIAQIELAMERQRWYPRNPGKRVVKVNIPQFSMQAMATNAQGDIESLSGKVIVGKPGRSHTPLFAGPITRIEFSPMWFVPSRYARTTLLPRLRRDHRFLQRSDMELRLPNGKTTQKVTKETLALVANGSARIQQRSGPKNALGRVKFILPNSRAIFMHDTNSPQLFGKDTRALSLGCVRLEKPLELARLLLANDSDWTNDRIEKAASFKRTTVARPSEQTIVMLSYETAVALHTGELNFFDDLYGMDKAAMKNVTRWANPKLVKPDSAEQLALETTSKTVGNPS